MSRLAFLSLILGLAATVAAGCKQSAPAPAADAEPPLDTVAIARYRAAQWKNHGCDLVTDAELYRLFSIDSNLYRLNTRTLPNQAFCLRSWHKPDWKERESSNEKDGAQYLSPKNSLILQVFHYGSAEHATQQFAMLRRDRRDTYAEEVPGIGAEALWSNSTVTLLVRKAENILHVAIEYSDQPHDNLEHAKRVAALALRKM
jgi:hypothetical protein